MRHGYANIFRLQSEPGGNVVQHDLIRFSVHSVDDRVQDVMHRHAMNATAHNSRFKHYAPRLSLIS